jgi:prophage regulatory protein
MFNDQSNFDEMPDTALVRLPQIIGKIAPVSRSTWWRMVKAGDAPSPVKLSRRIIAWRVRDLREWLAMGGNT